MQIVSLLNPAQAHEQAWAVVLQIMQTFDNKLIDDWKDELQNLLTFVRSSPSLRLFDPCVMLMIVA